MRSMCGISVGDAGRGTFINHGTPFKAFESEALNQWMGFIVHHCVGHGVTSGGNRLEAPSTPAAIHIKTMHWSAPHDGTSIGGDINRTRPLAHQLQTTERGEQLEHSGQHSTSHCETSPLAIGVV